MRTTRLATVLSLAFGPLLAGTAVAGTTPAPASATAGFANLHDGDSVSSPFTVTFTESGLTVAPAGAVVPNSGHYHLLIDTALTADQTQYAIPKDAQHLHFGKGQTEATVSLPPGRHTLQVVMGDGAHVPHDHPVMSKVITITVK